MRSRCSRISAPHLRIVTDEAWEAAHARLDAARAVYLKAPAANGLDVRQSEVPRSTC